MHAIRISTAITTFSALVLAAGGIALLFGSDELLAGAIPGAAVSATILGQLVAAGWLGIAGLNWNQRHVIIGGIYGRPMVLSNLSLYAISALSVAHPLMTGAVPRVFAVLAALFGVLALLYGTLLLRGPFGADEPAAG